VSIGLALAAGLIQLFLATMFQDFTLMAQLDQEDSDDGGEVAALDSVIFKFD
jgi:hypothetical protein